MNPFSTIKEIQALLKQKKCTPHDVRDFFQSRLKQHNPELNVAIEIFDEAPIDDEKADGRLYGIPGLIKDNICQQGHITSCGSKILENYRAPYDATVTARLKKAGAVILGRGNMDEFAMGASGEFSAYGTTYNPWNKKYSPGGSSSGPAAAVAAGLVPWALGSETGGSVRQPAAFCGIVGLYPTYGRFSRKGLVAFTSSTDQVGPLTKTVYDNALVASAISGHDPGDATSISKPPQDFTRDLNGKLPDNLTIGVIKDAIESEGINPEIKKAFEESIITLEQMGVKIKYIELPSLKYGISVYFVVSRAEAASNLSRFDGTLYGMRDMEAANLREMYLNTRNIGFGPEIKRRMMMGNFVLSVGHRDAFYTKANQVRSLILAEFEEAFREVDLLTSPTTPTLPFQLGKEVSDPLALYMGDYLTAPNCLAGLPALSFPAGFSKEGLPIGCQFIGPRLSEGLIYKAAYAFEQHTSHQHMTPPNFAP